MSNARDHEARTAEIVEVEPFDTSTINAARFTVAANSQNVDEAIEVMKMLGIHPSQEHDSVYVTTHAPLPNSASRDVANSLSSKPMRHTPPRVLSPLATLRSTRNKKGTR